MNIWSNFWKKICEPLDGFLWHRDITHPVIRPVLRNEILASGSCILIGGLIYIVFPWLFWFGCGIFCIAWIFWNWARLFLRMDPNNMGSLFFRAIILNFGGRFIILAVVLFLVMTIFKAIIGALIAGLVCGAFLALYSYARYAKNYPTS